MLNDNHNKEIQNNFNKLHKQIYEHFYIDNI